MTKTIMITPAFVREATLKQGGSPKLASERAEKVRALSKVPSIEVHTERKSNGDGTGTIMITAVKKEWP